MTPRFTAVTWPILVTSSRTALSSFTLVLSLHQVTSKMRGPQNNFCGDIGMPVRRDRIELGMVGIRTATRARLSDRFPMMSAA